MKKVIAYAILNKNGNLALIQSTLPIFWLEEVARERMSECCEHSKIIKVIVSEIGEK